MKKIKNILIVLGILIIIIIGFLILIKIINKDKLVTNEIDYEVKITINDSLERVKIRNNYYTVKSIVEQYYFNLCSLNKTSKDILIFEYDEEVEHLEEEILEEKENYKKQIYSYFDESLIKEMGLTLDNLQEKLGDYNNLYILIKDMYVRDITETIKIYFVLGSLTEKDTLRTEEFELMVATDSKNSTFNIYTTEYVNQHNLYELSKEKKLNEKYFNIDSIENRKYNKYEFNIIDDETYASDLLKSYTQSIKYNNIDYAYNKLDDEYRKQRFNSQSNYENYIKENKNNIIASLLKYYKYSKYDGKKQYTCIDQNGKCYIFREESIMNYTLILDTYTIDLPEFTEKYEVATTQEKVALNIQKIVEALNSKDYNYVYSKLADEFKNNNFETLEDFEEYAKKTFEVDSQVEFIKYTEANNLYTYKISLKGNNKNVTKTIIMQLQEGTDFVISFNV